MADKIVVRALLVAALGAGACGKHVADPVEDLAKRLGPETAGVMVMNHADVALPVVERELKFFHLDEKLAALSARAGRPLFSATDWAASGVDLKRPLAMAYIGPLRGIAVEVPVRDGKVFVEQYRSNLAKQGMGLTMRTEKRDGRDVEVVAGKKGDVGCFAVVDDVAVGVIAADSADPQATLSRLLGKHEGESLADNASFKALRATDEALSMWISPTALAMVSQLPRDPKAPFGMDWMASLQGMAVGIAVDDKAVRLREAAGIEGTRAESALPSRGGTKALDRIAGPVWAASRLDFLLDDDLRRRILSSEIGKQAVRGAEQYYAQMGLHVDIAGEVLPLLPTHVSSEGVLLAAPTARSAKDLEWVTFVDVTDLDKARALAAKTSTRTIDAAGAKWTVGERVAVGALDGKLVIVMSPDPAKTLGRAFAPDGPRALAGLPPSVADGIHDGPALFGWLRLEMFDALFGLGPEYKGEVTAGFAHRGDVGSLELASTWDTIHEVARAVPVVKARFDDGPEQTEMLALYDALQRDYVKRHVLPTATTPWTPAGDACARPDRKFPVDPSVWQAEPWRSLGFAVNHPDDAQYRIVRDDATHLHIEAQRDPICAGAKVRLGMLVLVGDGGLTNKEIDRIDATAE